MGTRNAETFLKFPVGFLCGTATSTTQIEGHIQNECTDFVASDGRTCHPVCDTYDRYKEDIGWVKKLRLTDYRMESSGRYCDNTHYWTRRNLKMVPIFIDLVNALRNKVRVW